MSKNNGTPDSLKGRIAAEKAAADQQAKQKTAAAWTIAKTMLPNAPSAEQFKFASALMQCSSTALKVATRQTAINAHWTRVAEQFADVHKVDMNDLLEDPSILSKEKSGVESELKGEVKNAGAKKADDRKDAGPLPAEYPEPKRDEPTELDGSKADKGRPDSWTEGPGSGENVKKSAAAKTACGEGCDGDCEHKKEAAAKTAEEAHETETREEGHAEEEAHEADEAADKAENAAEDADAAADTADDAGEATEDEPADDEAAEDESETFDPEKQNLEDIAADIEADNQRLQEAIADLTNEPDDLNLPEGGDFDLDLGNGDEDVNIDLGADGQTDVDLQQGGEELNLDDIFNEQNMTDKVSALNDEDEIVAVDGEDFFAPSDPAELESVLEQEESIGHPSELFHLDVAEDHDALAPLFASAKEASESTEIVKPGELDRFFETDLSGDDRDNETDHDGDIFESVYNSIKQPTRDDHRDSQPNLKEPKEAGKKAQAKGVRKLKPSAGPKQASTKNVNLASLLFTDESDFS